MSNKINIIAGLYEAFASETIIVSTGVKTLTEAKYKSGDEFAKEALITVAVDEIRYFYDGSSPSSTVGHLLNPRDSLLLIGTQKVKNFKAIRSSDAAGDAKITVSYGK